MLKPVCRLVRGAALVAVMVAGISKTEAAKVLVLSSENFDQDRKIVQVLEASGHVVTLGSAFSNFNLTTDLRGFETVVMQVNYNYSKGDMPNHGQIYLRNFVNAGGGLVTMGWVRYVRYSWSYFEALDTILPMTKGGNGWRSDSSITYGQDTADAVLNAGLPASFTFAAQNITGTEELYALKPGVTRYYTSDNTANIGVVGWPRGNGEVLSFAAMGGLASLNDANFATLMGNAAAKVAGVPDDAQLYKGLDAFVAPVVKVAGKRKVVTSKARYRLRGSASGRFRVARVEVQIGRKSKTALGTNAWARNIPLKPGKTKCVVRAVDVSGFVSAPVTVMIKRR